MVGSNRYLKYFNSPHEPYEQFKNSLNNIEASHVSTHIINIYPIYKEYSNDDHSNQFSLTHSNINSYHHPKSYKIGSFNHTMAQQEFIDPRFKLLHHTPNTIMIPYPCKSLNFHNSITPIWSIKNMISWLSNYTSTDKTFNLGLAKLI